MPVPCPHAMFIITLTYLKPVEDVDALMPGHVEWLDQGYADGLFLASGRRIPHSGQSLWRFKDGEGMR